jgi:hypothetical protein
MASSRFPAVVVLGLYFTYPYALALLSDSCRSYLLKVTTPITKCRFCSCWPSAGFLLFLPNLMSDAPGRWSIKVKN